MRKRWLKWAALPIAFTFVAAACSTSDDDDSTAGGTTATTAGGATATTAGGATGTTAAPGTTAGGGTGTTTGGGTGTTAAGASECISTPATTAAPGSTAPATTAAPGTTAALPSVPPPGTAGTVTVFGVEDSENEAGAMQDALTKFGEANGIDITYVGRRDFEQQINAQVLGGNPPDIAAFPQPGKLKQFAQDGELVAVPDDVVASVKEGWADSYLAFSNVDGKQYGVPFKSDFKSSVWYLPCAFEEKGYAVPETLDDFNTLVNDMAANGDTPLCVGIESGPATGWPFTDWVEELVLRQQGIDFYNQWVNHEVPFNDPKVVDTFNEVAGPDGYWKDGNVYASGGSIAATAFGDNGTPLVQGKCMMHRQASFYSAFFPEGTEFGDGPGQVSTFYFPADEGHPVLVGGISAGAFRDAPEVWKVMDYLGSADFANDRQAAQVARVGGEGSLSGFLTGNSQADTSLWAPLEQGFIESLTTADPAAFDASDQMPAEVGSGTFWTEGTSFVNGDEDAQTAADNIEGSWPS
jgi:alpha-glucoside transport system substrate-binding protein